jgi:hypothetical protein
LNQLVKLHLLRLETDMNYVFYVKKIAEIERLLIFFCALIKVDQILIKYIFSLVLTSFKHLYVQFGIE